MDLMLAGPAIAIIVIALLAIRVVYVFWQTGKPLRGLPQCQSYSTLIVLGSGGHTAEMLNLLVALDKDKFMPRSYVAAMTDNMSLQKAQLMEKSLAQQRNAGKRIEARYMQIYRSREVGQSYLTSVWTTVVAILHAMCLIFKIRPQVVLVLFFFLVASLSYVKCRFWSVLLCLYFMFFQILCNGPGTCIPLCVVAFLLKVVGVRWSYIFYVESIARVRKLSLSGLLLYELHMVDQLFVQWPKLQMKYPRAQYVGCLM